MTRFAALFDRRGCRVEDTAVDSLHRALGSRSGLDDGQQSPMRDSGFYACSASGEGGTTALAVTGEIENLADLARTLGLDPTQPCAAGTLGKGLERWGSALWPRLRGSFGLALFEPASAVLHLVCDPLGGRPLFYFEQGRTLAVASEIEVLLRWPGKTWGLDPLELARFFALEIPSPGKTHFAGVRQVEPGTAKTLTSCGEQEHRFWSPKLILRRSVTSDAEIADEFKERLETAVMGFMRDPARVGIMLSGGLDSTSLAVLASRNAADGADRVAACSWVFDDLRDCDERSWISQTLGAGDFEVIQVNGDLLWPLVDRTLFSTLAGSPEENPYRALKRSLYVAARTRGRSLLLNGGSADVLQRGGNLYLRDLLRAGRLRDGWHGLRRQVTDAGVRAGLGALARVLWPRGHRAPANRHPAWMTAEGRSALAGQDVDQGDRSRTFRDVTFLASEARSLALERQYARTLGVEVVSPYWTLDFVEFMLSLPTHQVYRPGTTKFVAREAMRGVIPDPIRVRQQPTRLDPLFERGLLERDRAAVDELLWRGTPLWTRFVSREAVAGVNSFSKPALKVLLWRCISFELWRGNHGWELA